MAPEKALLPLGLFLDFREESFRHPSLLSSLLGVLAVSATGAVWFHGTLIGHSCFP